MTTATDLILEALLRALERRHPSFTADVMEELASLLEASGQPKQTVFDLEHSDPDLHAWFGRLDRIANGR